MKDILKDPAPAVEFQEMGDFALQFKAKFFVADYRTAWGKKLEATEKIYDALNKAKLNIPYPTYEVHMKKLK